MNNNFTKRVDFEKVGPVYCFLTGQLIHSGVFCNLVLKYIYCGAVHVLLQLLQLLWLLENGLFYGQHRMQNQIQQM